MRVVVSQGVHIVSMFIPGWRDVLGVEPVAFTTWAFLLAITLSKFLVVESYKRLRGRELARRIYHGEPSMQPSRRGEGEEAKRPQENAARRKAG